MKKMFLVAVAAVMMCSSVLAQDNDSKTNGKKGNRTEMIQNMTNRMVSQYGLSDSQASQLLKLNTEYAGKMGPMGGRHGRPGNKENNAEPPKNDNNNNNGQQCPSKEEMDAHMKEAKANSEAYEKELKTIMNDEQYAKYEKDKKSMFQRRGSKPNGENEANNENNDNK